MGEGRPEEEVGEDGEGRECGPHEPCFTVWPMLVLESAGLCWAWWAAKHWGTPVGGGGQD